MATSFLRTFLVLLLRSSHDSVCAQAVETVLTDANESNTIEPDNLTIQAAGSNKTDYQSEKSNASGHQLEEHNILGHGLEEQLTTTTESPEDDTTSTESPEDDTTSTESPEDDPKVEEYEDADECPASMVPSTSQAWLQMYKRNKDLFFVCMHEVTDVPKMLSAKLLADAHGDQELIKLYPPYPNFIHNDVYMIPGESNQSFLPWAEKQKEIQRGVQGDLHYLVISKRYVPQEGESPTEPEFIVTRFNALTEIWEVRPNYEDLVSCDEKHNGERSVHCTMYEVAEKDLVCINTQADNEEQVEACKNRVADLIFELGDAQYDWSDDDSWWKDEVDGDTAAYCMLGGLLDDYIDNDEPWLAPSYKGQYSNLRSTQCLMASCEEAEGKVEYLNMYVCYWNMHPTIPFIVILFLLLFWFILMGVLADGYLVPALVRIGRGLKMSDALLGATLLALGGAANDFMTGLVAALQEIKKSNTRPPGEIPDYAEVERWLGGVFGTGFFVNTLVAAMVMLFAPAGGIPVIESVITRDIGFRILAVSMMIMFAYITKIGPTGAGIMVMTYVVYVTITLREAAARSRSASAGSHRNSASRKTSRHSVGSFCMEGKLDLALPEADAVVGPSFAADETPKERIARHFFYDDDMGFMDKLAFIVGLIPRPFFIFTMATGTWDPLVNPLLPLGMGIWIPIGSYALQDSILRSEAFGYSEAELEELWWKEMRMLPLIGLVCSLLVFFFSTRARGQARAQAMAGVPVTTSTYTAPITFSWFTFLTSILWISQVANEVMDALGCMGKILNVSDMVMGITALAWGNCIDNVFATVGLAKAGEFGVAITGIYAAPMFNVLFGNGSILLMTASMKKEGETPFVASGAAKIILFSVVAILAFTLWFTKKSGWKMTRTLGVILGISYPVVLFVAFALGS